MRQPLYHNFTTNEAPTNGSCSLQPTLGYPHETLFNVSCPGFEDIDEPITYTISLESRGIIILFSYNLLRVKLVKLRHLFISHILPCSKQTLYSLCVHTCISNDRFFKFFCSDDAFDNTSQPWFELFELSLGPQLADYIWIIRVRVIDVYWSTRVIDLRAKIGQSKPEKCKCNSD